MRKLDMVICFILLIIPELFFIFCLGLTPTLLGICLSATFYAIIVFWADLFRKRLV